MKTHILKETFKTVCMNWFIHQTYDNYSVFQALGLGPGDAEMKKTQSGGVPSQGEGSCKNK